MPGVPSAVTCPHTQVDPNPQYPLTRPCPPLWHSQIQNAGKLNASVPVQCVFSCVAPSGGPKIMLCVGLVCGNLCMHVWGRSCVCSHCCGGVLMENLSSFPLCHSSSPPKGLKRRARRGGQRDRVMVPHCRRKMFRTAV